MKKKDIIAELKRIRSHMADGTRCTEMMDELLAKLSPATFTTTGGGNGNGPPPR